MKRLAFMCLIGLAGAAVVACGGEEATQTAEECAQSTLISQCPLGSDPLLDARATSACEGAADASLVTEAGSVTGQCKGTGSCYVLCQFQVPCSCGVREITNEGIFCNDSCTACGNGTCEGGENATDCPEDCGVRCTVDHERCNGDHREVCNQNGQWDTLMCGTNMQCAENTEDKTTTCNPL